MISYIESLDPGHIARRRKALTALARAYREAGFFPETVTDKDVECFWIRLQPISGDKAITVGGEFNLPDKHDIDLHKHWAKHEIRY